MKMKNEWKKTERRSRSSTWREVHAHSFARHGHWTRLPDLSMTFCQSLSSISHIVGSGNHLLLLLLNYALSTFWTTIQKQRSTTIWFFVQLMHWYVAFSTFCFITCSVLTSQSTSCFFAPCSVLTQHFAPGVLPSANCWKMGTLHLPRVTGDQKQIIFWNVLDLSYVNSFHKFFKSISKQKRGRMQDIEQSTERSH